MAFIPPAVTSKEFVPPGRETKEQVGFVPPEPATLEPTVVDQTKGLWDAINARPLRVDPAEAIKQETWGRLSPLEKVGLDLTRAPEAVGHGLASMLQGLALVPPAVEPGVDNPMVAAELMRRARLTPQQKSQEVAANPFTQAAQQLHQATEKRFASPQPEAVNRPLGAFAQGVGAR